MVTTEINDPIFNGKLVARELLDYHPIEKRDVSGYCFYCNQEYIPTSFGEKMIMGVFKLCPKCRKHIFHL